MDDFIQPRRMEQQMGLREMAKKACCLSSDRFWNFLTSRKLTQKVSRLYNTTGTLNRHCHLRSPKEVGRLPAVSEALILRTVQIGILSLASPRAEGVELRYPSSGQDIWKFDVLGSSPSLFHARRIAGIAGIQVKYYKFILI